MDTRSCVVCGAQMIRSSKCGKAEFETRRFCSRICVGKGKDGQSWSKATGPWTPALIDRLKALHAENLTFDGIAQILGVSRGAVAGKAQRLGLEYRGLDQVANRRKAWSEAQVERLKELWGTNVSASAIGREFGLEHRTIIGKAASLGLPERPRIINTAGLRQYRPKSEPKPEPPPITVDLTGRPTLQELPFRGACKYAVGEREGTHLFCGEPTSHGSWCRPHRSVCFRVEVRR